MTVQEAMDYANEERLAKSDLQFAAAVRFAIIPKFLLMCRAARWSKGYVSLSFTPPTRTADMPDDFMELAKIYPSTGNNRETPLDLIDNELEIVAAELATTPGTPRGYYLVADTDGRMRRVKLAVIPAAATTLAAVYYKGMYFANAADKADQQIVPIPPEFHWGIVEGARAHLYERRFGVGDDRYKTADKNFRAWADEANAWQAGHYTRTVRLA